MTVGLIKPNSGNIYFDDTCITALPLYKRAQKGISYLPQNSSVFRNLTVKENIMAVLEMRKLSKQERKEKLDCLLEEFSITHIKKARAMFFLVVSVVVLK